MIVIDSKNSGLQLIQEKILDIFSSPSFSTSLLETVILTVTGFLLGYWFLPEASLFAISGFTWLIIGPLLTGLRYGFFFALISVVLSLCIIIIGRLYQLPWALTGSIPTICLMLLWVGFVAGGFRGYWQQKITKLTTTVKYLDQQLSEITKAHSLTKVSHDRLQELVVSQISLRDTILDVQRQILEVEVKNSRLRGLASIILNVLSDYGDIQMATLHEVKKNKYINPEAAGSIGNRKIVINPEDILLIEALEVKKTVSLKRKLSSDSKYKGALVLAIPLADSTGRVWGIVAVHQMPFRSYKPDNLKLISTLAGYIGDLLGRKFYSLLPAIKDAGLHAFLLQVQRCILDISSYNIPSAIISFEFNNKQYYEVISALLVERKRGLDQSWLTKNRDDNHVYFLLLPLTSESELEIYKTQILQLFEDRCSINSFLAADINFYQQMLLSNQSAIDVLDHLADKVNVDLSGIDSAGRSIYSTAQ